MIPKATMELLRPSCHSSPGFSRESFSGSSSLASFRRGFDRSTPYHLPEIVEEDVYDKVHVAVGKSVDKAMSLLNWTFKAFEGKDVCLLHVYQPCQFIPTPLGKLPASQANPEVVSAYRKYKTEQALTRLRSCLTACSAVKVDVSIIVTEADLVEKGIVDSVNKHGIKKLVIGVTLENCMKVKRRSSKANYAAKYVPVSCEISFIHKGEHLWTRYASSESQSSTCSSRSVSTADSSRPMSFRYSINKSIHPDYSQLNSDKNSELGSSLSHSFAARLCLRDLFGSVSNRSYTTASGYTSAESVMSSDSGLITDAERVYGQFVNAKMEAEASRSEAHADLLKLRKLKSEAREAVNKMKEFESSLNHEAKRRKEAEDALRTTLEDQEKILQARNGIDEELRWTRKNVALLDSWVQEANHRRDEASRDLKQVQESIATLRQEKQQIQRQKMEAIRWLERWRRRGQGRSVNCNCLVGSVEEVPELAEFSLSNLQSATCNFSESFKIGQGGFVYKGEMLGRTVAIRKLHPHNRQGESEFQQEVKVLGKLQHPHLVSLLGVCPEAWSIVYEYLPNGSLQDNLIRKNNVLTWNVRLRIIADIASALCFLHSIKPEKVVHGNLTPRKILLDSTLSCKITDFGISRLINEDKLCCPRKRWSTEPKAAFQYTDPEFPRIGIITSKSDVYSFGLIILQLLTRRPPIGLVAEVRKVVSSGKLEAILDSSAGEWPMLVARRLVEIALQCCELYGHERPDLTPCLVIELQLLHVSEERPVPSFFMCPILQEIMHDPQVAADGFTYEGEAMRGWLESGKDTSPMTNLRLPHLRLTPNHAIRLAIQDWLCNA